ncbi:MAG: DUF2007 domain-containing protein [Pseudoxanthomonas sp.]
MRQVFTSQRVETVEGVARLLNDAGIETAIRNGRSYQGKRGGQFSYTSPAPARLQPSLWVRHADDQPRAREILREAGLLDSTRPDQRNGHVFAAERDEDAPPPRPWAWRIRGVLLALIAAAAVFVWLHRRPAPPPQPQQPPAEEEVRVRIAPAGT